MLDVFLHAVDRALQVVFFGLAVADGLVFLPAVELDLLDGRVELLELGGVLDVRVAQAWSRRWVSFDLEREPVDLVRREPHVELSGAALVLAEKLRLAGLALEAVHLALDLQDDVGHAQQVLLGGVDLAQRLGLWCL
jgi:hypothetical protein